ncbi:E3 ubiquitin-protein ligase FANCL [Microtus ochrogaster]|uniref:E3 ubiquitin-protein ligase FANCL n=1 Tax=Microtus ochrogaster TaxID=79684 RepID=A0A8J6GSD0_MICOH|nr:E3 ubiquitin-protein ligase FANCL [Microtus ochrogaster]
MAETDANLLRHFPLLLPQNREKTVYEGFISAQGSDFHLRIILPKDRQLKNARLVCVDTSFSTIKLKAEDASGRKHLITVKLKAKYPVEPPECVVDFPVPFSLSWTPQSSLVNVHSQFLEALDSLKVFWDVMDEIDEKTWVLEPEKPPRSATARRIALGREGE